jgi:hypothetical protein
MKEPGEGGSIVKISDEAADVTGSSYVLRAGMIQQVVEPRLTLR